MLALLTSLLLAMSPATKAPPANSTEIRVVPIQRTPEPTTVLLRIAYPETGATVDTPVWVQFRLDGFALGTGDNFERANELPKSKLGQTVHVIIDDHPYFPINEPAIDPFDESGYYYNMSYKFRIPYRLGPGMHTIRMFPARAFGESLKGEGTFAEDYFFVGTREIDPNMDLRKPYLTYNEPSRLMHLEAKKPILLDFYITNAELSQSGYKVLLSIDEDFTKYLTTWQPYYIYGLKPGKHKIRLQLIDPDNRPVPGDFNDVTETIHIN